jgi:signal transduction histidine kinase
VPARRRLLVLLLRKQSAARRAVVWVIAVPGPPLIGAALVPLRSRFGLAGFLFCALLVVITVALLGGLRPALAAVVAGFLSGAFFFAPPYNSARVYLRLDNVPLVGFVVVGATIGVLVDQLAKLAEEQVGLRRADGALRRVATLVARAAPSREVFAAVTKEVGGLLAIDRAGLGRLETDGTVTLLSAWSREGEAIAVGGRWPPGAVDVAAEVVASGRPSRADAAGAATGWVQAVFGGSSIRSAIGTPVIVDARLWGVMIAGATSEAPLPADTEARLAAFTDLLATAIANAESRSELAASRERVVTAADETRRQIERDLHDGAQQRLVTLGLELRAAQKTVPVELGALHGELSRVADGLVSVMDELREMARGIHPAILAEGGLGPALRTLARRSAIPVALEVDADARLPDPIEIAAYYVVSESLTNAAKHAGASLVQVQAHLENGALHLRVRDDGRGGADPSRGSGLVGLRDRVEALGGVIAVHSPPGAGTELRVELPLER